MINVLHIAPSFYPAVAWGGPIFSTKAICDAAAADPEIRLRVLTTDGLGPNNPERLKTSGHEVSFEEGYRVYYARKIFGHSTSPSLLWRLPQAIAKADIIHLTGTYNFPTLPTLALARLLGKQVVWSPRGALQATAEWNNAPRRTIKRAFERVAQILRPKNCVLLVTAPTEAQSSTARLSGIHVQIIPNSVQIPAIGSRAPAENGMTRLVFLSRLHQKKGIEHLLDAMHVLPETFTLDIYGDGDPYYVRSLKERAAPLGQRVIFRGHVNGHDKTVALRDADLFVLPSHSENFGIAIAEALAAGTPVLTTTRTPWHALDAKGCGRCIDLDTADLAATLREMAKHDLREMGKKGRDWMIAEFSQEVVGAQLVRLYHTLALTEGQT